jgi:N,N'-diacetyllegionaminate synthase
MTKIVAEIGWNHMGDMDLAKRMISAAAENGADFAKFQTWSVIRLKPGDWDNDGRREIYEKAELSFEQHLILKKYCESENIEFLSSVFSVKDAELLKGITSSFVKIPSFESCNAPLLQYVNKEFDHIYLSTGTSTYKEINESVKLLDKTKTTLLHCVSSYPCDPSTANLPRIIQLRKLCPRVGYSDHIEGVESSKVALEYNINVIEKHFTVDHNLPGRDNKFAILPHELKDLSDYIKLRETMNKPLGEDFQEAELDSRNNYRGRFNG